MKPHVEVNQRSNESEPLFHMKQLNMTQKKQLVGAWPALCIVSRILTVNGRLRLMQERTQL